MNIANITTAVIHMSGIGVHWLNGIAHTVVSVTAWNAHGIIQKVCEDTIFIRKAVVL